MRKSKNSKNESSEHEMSAKILNNDYTEIQSDPWFNDPNKENNQNNNDKKDKKICCCYNCGKPKCYAICIIITATIITIIAIITKLVIIPKIAQVCMISVLISNININYCTYMLYSV